MAWARCQNGGAPCYAAASPEKAEGPPFAAVSLRISIFLPKKKRRSAERSCNRIRSLPQALCTEVWSMDVKNQDPRFDAIARKVRDLPSNRRAAAKEAARALLPKGRAHAAERAVFEAILMRINWKRDGGCYPSIARLMTDSGYSKSQVLRALRALRKAGLIMIKHRSKPLGDCDSNVYTIPVLIGPALPPVEREGGGVMDDTTGGVVDETTGGLTDATLTIEGGTSEGLTGERTSSSNPQNIIRNSTASETLAARARGAEKEFDDGRSPPALGVQHRQVISLEAAKWLCDVTGLPPAKIFERVRDVGVGLAHYDEAIRRARIRYNAGQVKRDLLGYIDEIARNLAKGTRAPTSPPRRPLIGFEQLSAVLQATEHDLFPEPEMTAPPRRPVAPSASLLNSALVKR